MPVTAGSDRVDWRAPVLTPVCASVSSVAQKSELPAFNFQVYKTLNQRVGRLYPRSATGESSRQGPPPLHPPVLCHPGHLRPAPAKNVRAGPSRWGCVAKPRHWLSPAPRQGGRRGI